VGIVAYGVLRYAYSQSCTLTISQEACGVAYEADGRYDLAQLLSEYQDQGYVLATTEAGLLPLYSNWKSVDAWGLNDAWIAHHGEITAEYLDRHMPQLIVFHAYYSPLVPPRINSKNMAQDWFRTTITLKSYAEAHNYILAPPLATVHMKPITTTCAGISDSERIERLIMKDYLLVRDGQEGHELMRVANPRSINV
jgi:hypothetical protein